MNESVRIQRIAILNLDSFASGEGVRKLIETLHDRIVLICASQRFGGKYGTLFQQIKENYKRAGFKFIMYQALNLTFYHPMIFLADSINLVAGCPKRVYSLSQLAYKYNIPIVYTKEIGNPKIVTLLKEQSPDLIISFYFDQVIRRDIIQTSRVGIINIHTACLPKCRGPFPILCSLIHNIDGYVSIHGIVDETLDTGFLFTQRPYHFKKGRSVLWSDRDSLVEGAEMVIDLLNEIEADTVTKKPQQGNGFYMAFPTREDLQILKRKGIKLFSIREFIKTF